MSLKDKLEVGLKPDAPYRPDNLPDFQQEDPSCQDASVPGDSTGLRQSRDNCDVTPAVKPRLKKAPVRRSKKAE